MRLAPLLLLVSGAALAKPAVDAARPTDSARPTVEVLPLDGYAKKVLAPRKGHRFAVNFWATWCEPCREELPSLLAGAAAKKVELVLVSLDSADRPEPLREFLQSVRAAGSLVVAAGDPQPFIDGIDKKWDGTLPYTIIYGADGRIVTRLPGAQSRAGFERALTP